MGKYIKEGAFPLVMVEWIDAKGCCDEWTALEHITRGADKMLCQSFGLLLKKDKDVVIILPHVTAIHHVTDTGKSEIKLQGCGDMTIPTIAVKRIRKLRF